MNFSYRIDDDIELRIITPWDLDALWALIERNSEALRYWFSAAEIFRSREALEADYRQWMERTANGEGWSLGIGYRGELVGVVWHAQLSRLHGSCVLGYWLDEKARGKGVVTRAVRAMIDFSLRDLGLRRVEIGSSVRNRASCAVAERLGFQREGVLRNHWRYADGTSHDMAVYGLLAEEWKGESEHRPVAFTHDLGDGLSLRLGERRHAEEVFAAVDTNREHLRRWLAWVNTSKTAEDPRKYLTKALRRLGEGEALQLSILERGGVVGAVHLERIRWDSWAGSRLGTADIGYWLTADAQGRGLATRSVAAVLDFAFGRIWLERVVITAEPDNRRSCAIPERLGFTHEGTLRGVARYDGRRVDQYLYAMLAEEWKAAAPSTQR